jgi:hypothetical protein
MLCLSTWSGLALSKASQTQVLPCYAKLGGKYVGELRICGSTSAYQVLQYVQVQASKLLPHAWRDFDDIMIWCDNQWLIPSGFAYRDDLTQEEEEQAWSAIQNTKRLEVMWDDNDEYAKAHVSENTFKVVGKVVHVDLDKDKELLREVVGLLKRSRLQSVCFIKHDERRMNLTFLKSTTFTEMTLIDTLPPDWSGLPVKLVRRNTSTFKRRSWPNSDGIIPTTCWPYTHNIVNLERFPTSQGTDTAPQPDSAVTSSRSRLDSLLIPTSELERPSNVIASSVSNLHVLDKLKKSINCTVQGKDILKDFKAGKAQRSPIVAAELWNTKCFMWKLNPQRSSSRGASTALESLRDIHTLKVCSNSECATSPFVASDALATSKSVSPSYTTSMRSAPCKAPSKPAWSWSRQSLNGKLGLVTR